MTEPKGSTHALHPIRVVARRTGLSPHVLRAWERRYGAIRPRRSSGGQRLYSDRDLERLDLLRRLVAGGHGIGQLAGLDQGRLEALAAATTPRPESAGPLVRAAMAGPGRDPSVEDAVAAVEGFDAQALQSLLDRAAMRLGVPGLLDEVVVPLLREIGDRWRAGRLSAAQEHQATVVVRRTLGRLLERYGGADRGPGLVAATPAGERHELGALLAAVAAAASGWRVAYLGADLPAGDLAAAAERTGARVVALSVIRAEDDGLVLREVADLRKRLPQAVALLLGGAGALALREGLEARGVEVIPDLAGLRERLAGPAAGAA